MQQGGDGEIFVASCLEHERGHAHEVRDIRNGRGFARLPGMFLGREHEGPQKRGPSFIALWTLVSPWRTFFLAKPSLLFSAPRQQIGANERLQIAVEHAIHVADFHLGAVVFDHAIGLQHVRANLRSELDVEL